MKTLSDLGELDTIKLIEQTLKRPAKGRAGKAPVIADFKEDAAIFRVGSKIVAISTDMGVSSTHLPGANAFEMGRKIAVSANTDLLAKGALPKFFWLDFAAPKNTPAQFIKQLYLGINFELKKFGAFIVGGDTNKGSEFCYSATVFGEIQGKPLLRKNSRPSDLLVITGEVGSASAGLFCILNKKKCPQKFLAAQKTPQINFALCKKLMKIANAGVDVSDGMGKELSDMAMQSNAKLVLDWENIPFDKRLPKLCKENNWALEDILFHRGEDYQVIYSIPKAKEKQARLAGGIVFGRVEKAKNNSEVGLFLQKNGALEKISAKGYEHFKDN